MVQATLWASALVGLPLALTFLFVAERIHRRSRREGQPPLTLFAVFWAGIGTYGLVEALWTLAWLAGAHSMVLALFVLHLKIVSSVCGLGGLVLYLLVLRGAPARVLAAVAVAYGVLLALAGAFYAWRDPVSHVAGTWGMRLEYARDDTQPWWTILSALLFVPPLAASVSYAFLLRHTDDPLLRYRIAMTSASLMLFFLPAFLGWRAGGFPWWGAVEKSLVALMALGVVMALFPPAWVRARLAGAPHRSALARHALLARARELI